MEEGTFSLELLGLKEIERKQSNYNVMRTKDIHHATFLKTFWIEGKLE